MKQGFNYYKGDVKLHMIEDGFELSFENGLIECTEGFDTAVYLSLFGGNELDNVMDGAQNKEWWGNKIEGGDNYRSRTLSTLNGKRASLANLKLLEQMVNLDLDWIKKENIGDKIEVEAEIPSYNKLKLNINILKNGKLLHNTAYKYNWHASLEKN